MRKMIMAVAAATVLAVATTGAMAFPGPKGSGPGMHGPGPGIHGPGPGMHGPGPHGPGPGGFAFRGRGFRGGYGGLYAFGGPWFYGYGCYQWRHVLTPFGWRWRRIYVCY